MQRLLKRVVAVSDHLIGRVAGSRWYLLLRTVPRVILACLTRLVLVDWLHLGVFPADIVNTFSQTAIFVVAILLSGVLEDYKEAEGFPDALAAEFEAASDRISYAAGLPESSGKLSPQDLRGSVLAALGSVFCFLGGKMSDTDVIASVSTRFRAIALELAQVGAGDCAEAVLTHAFDIRKIIGRLYVIKRTDFLQSGAALMELLVNITVFLAILQRDVEHEHWLTSHCSVAFTAFQFFYVIELLRDIDDPFEYDAEALLPIVDVEDGGRTVGMRGAGNSAEVDLFPIFHAYGRIMQGATLVKPQGIGASFARLLHDRMVVVWGTGSEESDDVGAKSSLQAHMGVVSSAATTDPDSSVTQSVHSAPPLEMMPLLAEPSLGQFQTRTSFPSPPKSSSSPHLSHSPKQTPHLKLHSHDSLRMAAAAAAALAPSGSAVASRLSASTGARAAALKVTSPSAAIDYARQPQRDTLFSSHIADRALQDLRHRTGRV